MPISLPIRADAQRLLQLLHDGAGRGNHVGHMAGPADDPASPDYRGPDGVWTRDPDAKGAVSAHKAKGGAYTTCEYGTYEMSKR